jgi:hypothetical protein
LSQAISSFISPVLLGLPVLAPGTRFEFFEDFETLLEPETFSDRCELLLDVVESRPYVPAGFGGEPPGIGAGAHVLSSYRSSREKHCTAPIVKYSFGAEAARLCDDADEAEIDEALSSNCPEFPHAPRARGGLPMPRSSCDNKAAIGSGNSAPGASGDIHEQTAASAFKSEPGRWIRAVSGAGTERFPASTASTTLSLRIAGGPVLLLGEWNVFSV